MIIKSAGNTDPGKIRPRNEDNFYIDNNLGLFIVCDGMGGHQRGDVASKIAVIEIKNFIEKNKFILDGFLSEPPSFNKNDIINLLRASVLHANESIYLQGDINSELRGMGTTISVLLILKKTAFILQAGDTRIYLFRDNTLNLLTQDHSLFFELVKQGRLSHSAFKNFPFKNVVTKALGVHPTIEPDTFALNIIPDDTFLLTSDGLHIYFEEEELKEFLLDKDLEKIVRILIDKAKEEGGHDNITAILVNIQDEESPEYDKVRIRLKAIDSLPLFSNLTYTEKILFLDMCENINLKEGEKLFEKGEDADAIYILLSGKIKIIRDNMEIANFVSFSHFGEISLVEKGERLVNAIAGMDCELLSLDRKKFLFLLSQNSTLAVKILWNLTHILSSRLKATNDELLLLKTQFSAEPIFLIEDEEDTAILPSTFSEKEKK